jgi:hypothetical protein
MKTLPNLELDIRMIDIPGARKHGPYYRVLSTYDGHQGKRQSAVESSDDSPNGLFSVLLGAAIMSAAEMERMTGRKFRKPLWLRVHLAYIWLRLEWAALIYQLRGGDKQEEIDP